MTTREPGGSPGAEEIRALLLDRRHRALGCRERGAAHGGGAAQPSRRHDLAGARRRPHGCCATASPIRPMAYQGCGRGLPRERLHDLHRLIAGDFQPTLTLILDLPVDEGLARAVARPGGETASSGCRSISTSACARAFSRSPIASRSAARSSTPRPDVATVQAAIRAVLRDSWPGDQASRLLTDARQRLCSGHER